MDNEYKINKIIQDKTTQIIEEIDKLFHFALSQGTILSSEENPCIYYLDDEEPWSYVIESYDKETNKLHIYWTYREGSAYEVGKYSDYLDIGSLNFYDKLSILLYTYDVKQRFINYIAFSKL